MSTPIDFEKFPYLRPPTNLNRPCGCRSKATHIARGVEPLLPDDNCQNGNAMLTAQGENGLVVLAFSNPIYLSCASCPVGVAGKAEEEYTRKN